VEQAAQEPSHLLTITKTLYPNVAQQFQTDWRSVERNIRTAVSAAWAQSPGRLEQVAGHPFPAKPSAAQVIAVLSNCLQTA
jgi:two-component system response regulator (stage 0 sporulation protein A)